jgi:HAD superfamily hydrolase (TIGR01509 family)
VNLRRHSARGIIDAGQAAPAGPGRRVDAVMLDAYGTILELSDPVPRMWALLAAEGYEHPPERVAVALVREIVFYKRHQDRGRDPAALALLRADCARVLGAALGPDRPPLPRLTEILLDSLRMVLLPDAREALDRLAAGGVRLAMVSNWDCSLPVVLEQLGVLDRFEAVVASAAVGIRKPAGRIFRVALERLGVAPERALHCGDDPEADCLGARWAGIAPVLVDRVGRHPGAPWLRVASLAELPSLAGLDPPVGSRR